MGCISSKHVVRSSISPLHNSSVIICDNRCSPIHSPVSVSLKRTKIKEEIQDDEKISNEDQKSVTGRNHVVVDNPDVQPSNSDPNNNRSKRVAFSLQFGRLTEGEHVAAGWPSWLSAAAGEAIDGLLPLKSESFQRLEKIGQGTYSSVYRARDVESGRTVALKKVRFDNLQPESVKFMAREITILRRLDHPNIMKLEGIITSRLSCNVYFVFEYMEHDLSGLLACPDIKFSDSQIKCYMRQLLNGIKHFHSLGIMHRDIKTANILVNNEGLLKIADFGLANFHNSKSKQLLTSRVVTLWYRPPELLLGCTKYGMYVDLWSVGCVFAELFLGRPILKGRTEVEQLHKIFKLCGTPPDEYWKKSKLPLAAMFRPHHAYGSTLRERCKELPETAVNLIDTFLSVEPYKRGTARSALESEYFNTKPYACDPANLPKYPPNKEINAKARAEACRKRPTGVVQASGASRNPRVCKAFQEQTTFCKVLRREAVNADAHVARRSNGVGVHPCRSRDTASEVARTTEAAAQSDNNCILPAQATASSGGFTWARRRWNHGGNPTPASQNGTAVAVHVKPRSASEQTPENGASTSRVRRAFRSRGEIVRRANRSLCQPDSFESSKVHNSQDLANEAQEQERNRRNGVHRSPFCGGTNNAIIRVQSTNQVNGTQLRITSSSSHPINDTHKSLMMETGMCKRDKWKPSEASGRRDGPCATIVGAHEARLEPTDLADACLVWRVFLELKRKTEREKKDWSI